MEVNIEGAKKADIIYEEFRRSMFLGMEKEFETHFNQPGNEAQMLANMVVARALLTGCMPYKESHIPQAMRSVAAEFQPYVDTVEEHYPHHSINDKIKKVIELHQAHQK